MSEEVPEEMWRKFAECSCWRHPWYLITQYQFSVPVTDLEVTKNNPKEICELILNRLIEFAEEKLNEARRLP